MKGWGARPVLACSGDTPTEQGAGLERLPDRANNLDEHCDIDRRMLITHQYAPGTRGSPTCAGRSRSYDTWLFCFETKPNNNVF